MADLTEVTAANDLDKVHQFYLDYAKNSGTVVTINRSMETVSIVAGNDTDYFLQGDEAEQWILGLDRLIDTFPDTYFSDLELIAAYPYLDLSH